MNRLLGILCMLLGMYFAGDIKKEPTTPEQKHKSCAIFYKSLGVDFVDYRGLGK